MVIQQKKKLVEVIGWTGALASLTGFALNSLQLIEAKSISYLVLNIIGCSLLIVYAVSKKAHASWVLNSIWLLITLFALVKVFIAY